MHNGCRFEENHDRSFLYARSNCDIKCCDGFSDVGDVMILTTWGWWHLKLISNTFHSQHSSPSSINNVCRQHPSPTCVTKLGSKTQSFSDRWDCVYIQRIQHMHVKHLSVIIDLINRCFEWIQIIWNYEYLKYSLLQRKLKYSFIR